jgi:hypothetical protein
VVEHLDGTLELIHWRGDAHLAAEDPAAPPLEQAA